ncbi:MAG: hypothetical protein Q8933_02735 [Bacteroidota bacterium]|nr:hypothetical protein [Bacteroidota bacterium]
MAKYSGLSLIDMKNYSLPAGNRVDAGLNLRQIYAVLPRNSKGVRFDIYNYEMLFKDEPTKRIIREGNTIGCFYIESPGMRSLLKKLSVDTFEMLTAASSIIRPGVAESGMMQEFIARHKDPARRKYLMPELELHLGETYGVMIYQEDVLKVAHHIAGLSLEEADLLRRAMSGKMRSQKMMQTLMERFFNSCKEKDLSEENSRELWRQIESFAGYAFCKAHSGSFALMSFQMAYLKAHYPSEFISSVLTNQGGFYAPAVYIQEAKRLGLKVLLPSVNESTYEYAGKDDKVQLGFMAIKNFSYNSAERIIRARKQNGPFLSLSDFLIRTSAAYEESALLIKCGAMDCFKKTRPALMRLLDIYFHRRKILEKGSGDLFIDETIKMEEEIATDTQYSDEEICAIEYETFGYMLRKHPLEFFTGSSSLKTFAESKSPIILAKDLPKYSGRYIKMMGWYMTSKRIRTKKGEIMKFLSLEDLTGTFEAILFPKTYMQYAEYTVSMGPYLIEGMVDKEGGNNLIVNKLEILSSEKIKLSMQKDSVENNYYGDVETVTEEEMFISHTLDNEKLQKAYMTSTGLAS